MGQAYNNRRLGEEMERRACALLEENGYRIIKRNYRNRYGEIDVIAADGSVTVFVEVKYRNNCSAGSPREAVDKRKQRQISKTALFYLCQKGYNEEIESRFDVILMTPGEEELIKNAFEFCYGR